MKKLIFLLSFCFLSSCSLYPQPMDPKILSQPCLIPAEADVFELCRNYAFYVGKKKYRIPRGFRTDLASIPRLFWLYDAPVDFISIAPAVVHDYLYRCFVVGDRKFADDMFYYLLIKNGASHATAIKFYLGVRIFGGQFYGPNECNDDERAKG